MSGGALLDGDIIAYRASTAAEEDIDWGDGMEGPSVDHRHVKATTIRLVKEWTRAAGCGTPVVCLSPRDGHTFRKDLGGSYKVGRSAEKPLAYWSAIDAMEDNFRTVRYPKCEGDDVIGILATGKHSAKFVVVSIDKDMRTLPCRLFVPGKSQRPERIREASANRYWMLQTLTGDVVDGYKGCPGIGEKRAQALLADCSSLVEAWKRVVQAFKDKGLTYEDALLNARYARILRASDFDHEAGRVKLWSPPEGW